MIATDRATSEHLKTQVGAKIGGQMVTGFAGECYRGNLTDCPLCAGLSARSGRGDSRHPIFDSLPPNAHVATNRPSVFASMEGLMPVATIRSPDGNFDFGIGKFKVPFPNECLLGATR